VSLSKRSDGRVAGFPQRDGHVERRDPELHLGEPAVGRWLLLGETGGGGKLERDLEQRVPREVALRLQLVDEHLERHVLVFVRGECGLAHAPHEVPERRVAAEVGTKDERVDEEADQPLDFGAVAVRDICADGKIVLAGVAGEQRLEGRKQSHEERRALPVRELAQPRY
jgi:hypothetical protein